MTAMWSASDACRTPAPEQGRGPPHPAADPACRSERDVLRCHPEHQHPPTEYVQCQHHAADRGDRRPIGSVESGGLTSFWLLDDGHRPSLCPHTFICLDEQMFMR